MDERILIIEDEDTLRESLSRVFTREGYQVVPVNSAEPALELFEEGSFDLILTDIILPGITGIELLKRVKEAAPDQVVIIMTAYASLETAVETLRSGAYDYIVKPIIHEEIKQIVKNALKVRALQKENVLLKKQMGGSYELKPDYRPAPRDPADHRPGQKDCGDPKQCPVYRRGRNREAAHCPGHPLQQPPGR